MKKLLMLALTVMFLFSGLTTVQAELKIPAVYVALGDSLAAGQTPDRKIDTGYTDLIAQELSRNQPLAFYTKNLAYPGFTTENVLETVRSAEAEEALHQANLITLSAGANDLLPLVQSNPSDGSLAFQQIPADYALDGVRENMAAILKELQTKAPNASVYVMGYYFPYPHARESQKAGMIRQLDRLNAILKQEAERTGAVFVPVSDAFGPDAVDKLPNPADVHPNLTGYQAMANAFFSQYQPQWSVEELELPSPNPLTFEQMLAAQEAQSTEQEEQPAQAVQAGQQQDEEPADAGCPETEESAVRPSEETDLDYLALARPIFFT